MESTEWNHKHSHLQLFYKLATLPRLGCNDIGAPYWVENTVYGTVTVVVYHSFAEGDVDETTQGKEASIIDVAVVLECER
jgi:hypothetical protein